jgi:hypothetical protein
MWMGGRVGATLACRSSSVAWPCGVCVCEMFRVRLGIH